MKRFLLAIATVLMGATMVAADANAARMGGGRSSGMQRNYTAPPASAPARQAAPATNPQPPATAPASGLSRWMPMIGGLALGGLLGSMLGGNGLGSLLLLVLLAAVAFMLVRMVMRARQPSAPPMQFSGLGAARVPFESAGSATPLAAPAVARIPDGFDVAGFLRAAKTNFIKLQVANDLGDLETIREVATPEMYEDLSRDVRERREQRQVTDVVSVDADLLEVVTEGSMHIASVRFSGLVREEPGTPPQSFSEVWNLTKPADGSSGWLLAGIQQELAR